MKRIFAYAAALAMTTASCTRTYTVEGDSGADIQRTIDMAYSEGGGRVIVPEGTYNVASVLLKSNIDLHLEKGAVLLGSGRSEDYDSFPQDICFINPAHSTKVLVYAYNCENIAITGEGTIDGNGPSFFEVDPELYHYRKPPVERPIMVKFVGCKGVRIDGVTLKDSPLWTGMLRLCENVEVHGINITADQKMINNDGIDFDGCRHVRVSNSTFRTGDDCIVLRAIQETPQQHIVCEDIEVENCSLNSACQTIRLGCPSDDTIRNAVFRDISASGNNGIFADFPKRYLKGDTGHCHLINIAFENYSGEFFGSALQIVSEPGVTDCTVDGMTFRNCSVKSRGPLRFIGNKGYEIGSVILENFDAVIEAEGEPYKTAGCKGLEFRNVTINGQAADDGIVEGAEGSDEKLGTVNSESWKSSNQKH